MFDCLKRNKECMPYPTAYLTDKEKIERLKEEKRDVIEELYKQSPDYKIVFRPNSWENVEKDYEVRMKDQDFQMNHTCFYTTVKRYETRKEAEVGMKLIKEEMAKN